MISIRWAPRTEPLTPVAAAAIGACARELARRLLLFEASRLAALSGVAGSQLLLVSGSEEHLPWVDGIAYLGRDPSAPGLLMPTTLAPSVPGRILESVVQRMGVAPPVAVLPDAQWVVSVAELRPLSLARLREWTEAHP